MPRVAGPIPGALALATSILSYSSAQPPASSKSALTVDALSTPAAPGSAQPQLSLSTRGVLISWVERTGTLATLKFSEKTLTGWTPARAAASGTDWFVNWADVPSVVRLDDGTLVAHWLQKTGPDTYAYDVRLSYSRDDGKTWAASFTPHHDGTKTEHGFASLFPMPGAGLGLVWLDGRAMTRGHGDHGSGDMSLRFSTYGRDWKQTLESAVDLRVCECCPTAAAMTPDGPIVAFRNRGPDEMRDIHVSRLENGKWTESRAVHNDGWIFPACPVNGPALSASDRDVAVAWFTGVNVEPKSYAAFSSDGGRTFGTPILIDDEGSLGRVDIELLPDGSAAAAYVALTKQGAELRVRRVQRTGATSAPVKVATLVNNRTSGYPRMAISGSDLILAWTDRSATSQVRTAIARIAEAR